MALTWAEKWAIFERCLEASDPAVSIIAQVLRNRGWEVEKPELNRGPDGHFTVGGGDKGDLFIRRPGWSDDDWIRVEAKELGKAFPASFDDWNWRFEEGPHRGMPRVSVSNTRNFDKKLLQAKQRQALFPSWVMSLSSHTDIMKKNLLWIDVRNRQHMKDNWEVITVWNHIDKQKEPMYFSNGVGCWVGPLKRFL